MVEIKNENRYVIGDKVWWFDSWGTLRNGTIYGFTENADKRPAALIHENGRVGSCTGALVSDCWPSKEICLEKERERSELQIKEYKESIGSVHDLVVFLYNNQVNGEDPDWDAKKAVEERAAELGVPVV